MACAISNSEASEDISSEKLDEMCAEILKELTDDAILGLCFEVHRAVKLGYFFLDEGDYSEEKFEIKHDEKVHDIFGHNPAREALGCNCPKCGAYSPASRFVIHLKKCINKRQCAIKTTEKPKFDFDTDSEDYEDESDDSRKGRKRSNKKQTKKQKGKKGRKKATEKNGTANGNTSMPIYLEMTTEEHRAHLSKACGVISEWTKKMCTKSLKCSRHTEEQRRLVRYHLLESVSVDQLPEEVPVDVDSVV